MDIKKEYGYVLIIALLLYITQQVLMVDSCNERKKCYKNQSTHIISKGQ